MVKELPQVGSNVNSLCCMCTV